MEENELKKYLKVFKKQFGMWNFDENFVGKNQVFWLFMGDKNGVKYVEKLKLVFGYLFSSKIYSKSMLGTLIDAPVFPAYFLTLFNSK